MKYRLAIVEDNLDSAEMLKKYIKKYAIEHNEDFEVYHYLDGDEITSNYEAKYDIIFLDIEMKRLDGMTAAKHIREFDQEVIIIFITNMSHYAIKGYSVNATNFLLKPVPYFPFSQELKHSLEKIKGREQKYVLVPTAKGTTRLSISDILYVESMKHQLIFITKDEEYRLYGTMKDMENQLADYNFYRCNNCYLVNLAMVAGMQDDSAYIGQHKLKISRPRKKGFMEALAAYVGGS